MIRGHFSEGRPYVTALMVFRGVGAAGEDSAHVAALRFLLDTGADRTVLAAADVEQKLGLSISALPFARARIGSVAGQVAVHSAAGTLHLRDESGRWVSFSLDVLVPEPAPDASPLAINVLGADVWGQGDVHVNRPAGVVSIEFPAPSPA